MVTTVVAKNMRYPRERPLLIGDPDGIVRLARARAHLSGVPVGSALWVTGTGVDAASDTIEVLTTPEEPKNTESTEGEVDLDALDLPALRALAEVRGVVLPKTANSQQIRKILRGG